MQVEIKIDSSYTEPKILIFTASVTEDINNIVKKLSEDVPQIISGSRDNKIEVLDPAELIRIYANTGKSFRGHGERGIHSAPQTVRDRRTTKPSSVCPHLKFRDHQPEPRQ